jgi:hypothetical protein
MADRRRPIVDRGRRQPACVIATALSVRVMGRIRAGAWSLTGLVATGENAR